MALISALSPGVYTSEIDLTTIIPGVSTSVAAFAGDFLWGPINQVVTVDLENPTFVERFGKPGANNFTDWYTVANFLAYSNNVKVVRAANTTVAKNATADAAGLLIRNEEYYREYYGNGEATVGSWGARYAGELGNSIKVSTCFSANAFQGVMAATANVTTGNTTVIFSANVLADAQRSLQVGDLIRFGSNGYNEVTNISSTGLSVTMNSATALGNATAISATAKWAYADSFQAAPGTSSFVSRVGGSDDEMHLIVIDRLGRFSGQANAVLEKYSFVSKALDARTDDGSSNYYRNSIADKSAFIYNLDHYAGVGVLNWGNTANNTSFTTVNRCEYVNLAGGVDGPPNDGEIVLGYDFFKNVEEVDISLLLTSDHSPTVQGYVISNIAEFRGDCVAFISPPRSTVVDNRGDEATDAGTWKDALTSSSYYFTEGGWKWQFDKYSNTYRYLPMNGDTAGLAARTDMDRDAWWSFAGLNRGQYKNVIKLSWNPSKTYRDELYRKSINPVVTFPGEGTVLFGDKTGLAKPSAFDRINVRRLFIVLRKAISKAARYSLFEFNDEFTRAQFVNMVEPFLRDVKGRRGIYDFKVVCDERNNTPERIDRNEFWADIYIKPARSINFIQLNFIATPTGVAFEEVVGKF